MMKQIVCIAGPTASGKSAFAVKLAKKCDGEVINADALQVYRQLHVLSARPDREEMDGIAHHLYGHINASVRYSTGMWLKEVDGLIIDILARGKTPILVGGTGLYFKALTQGLAKIPQPDERAIMAAQNILDEQGINALRAKAEELDPAASQRVLGEDPQRLLRIVNVALGTGKPISVWQQETKPVLPRATWRGIALLPKREAVYAKINARFSHMVENGGLEEARRVRALGLATDLPAMKAIGLRELTAHLDGQLTLDEAVETAMRETRRFAKRQFTWIRGQMKNWEKIET